MEVTYKLTLAPVTSSEGITGHLQSINVQAQLTPFRTPARGRFTEVGDFVAAFGEVMPTERAERVLERLTRGEVVVLEEPVPRRTLLAMQFDFI